MRAECYSMDVYCDGQEPTYKQEYHTMEQFSGRNAREVHQLARARGWFLGPKDYCPECKRKLK